MSNDNADGYDWLQTFLTEGQASYYPASNYSGPVAHPAFRDAEVAKANFRYSQEQNAYALSRQSNSGANSPSNLSQGYPKDTSGHYGGSQQYQHSKVRQPQPQQQQHSFANRSSGSFQHQPDSSQDVSRQSSQSASSQLSPTYQLQRMHPSTIPDMDAYHELMQSSVYRSPSGNLQYQRTAMPSLSQPRQNSSVAQETARPSQPPHRPFTWIPGHHHGPRETSTDANDRGTETGSQNVAHAQNAHGAHPRSSMPPVPAFDHRPSLESAAVQESRPTQLIQRTQSPVERAQYAPQSPYQIQSAIPVQNVERQSQSQTHPGSYTSRDLEGYTHLTSPQGHKTSAVHTTTDPFDLSIDLTKAYEAQPAYKGTAPSVSSICQQESIQSPAAPAALPAQPVAPTQTVKEQPNPDKAWNGFEGNNHGKVAPRPKPSWQAVNQPLQPNGHDTARLSKSTTKNVSASKSSPVLDPPTAAPQKRSYPNENNARPSSSIGRVAGEVDSQIPLAKVRRLDNGQREPVAPQVSKISQPWPNAPSPNRQLVEPERPWRQGKILKNRDDLVQRITPSLALEKTAYDPTTIARDVLIAAGKHPTEKKLNHHLESLRLNFTRIDNHVDLATFRWDLADASPADMMSRDAPRNLPQSTPKPVPHTATRHIPHVVPQTIPPIVPQAASIPVPPYAPQPAPQPAPLPKYIPPARPVSGQYVSPDTLQCGLIHGTPRDTPPSPRIDARATANSNSWGALPFKSPTHYSPKRGSSSLIRSGLPNLDPIPHPNSSPRKPPAPPKLSPKTSPLVFVPSPPSHPKQPTPARIAPPPAIEQRNPKSTPKKVLAGQTVKASKAKSLELQRLPQPLVVIPASPHKMSVKRKPGRPAGSKAKAVEVAIPRRETPVNYQIFPCRWEGCVAELHNLDAVRAHLVKVHVPHHLLCKWKDCGNTTHMAAADMFSHVANEHISKMAWELGDGPVVPETAETTPPQPLFGRSSRKGTMVLPVDEFQLKAYCKAHGITTERAKAEALLEAGRHWKQQIGPELDLSDRRLSTPVRQENLNCSEMAFVSPD